MSWLVGPVVKVKLRWTSYIELICPWQIWIRFEKWNFHLCFTDTCISLFQLAVHVSQRWIGYQIFDVREFNLTDVVKDPWYICRHYATLTIKFQCIQKLGHVICYICYVMMIYYIHGDVPDAGLSLFVSWLVTWIPAWISNYTHFIVWGEITYQFPNFNGATVEVWE